MRRPIDARSSIDHPTTSYPSSYDVFRWHTGSRWQLSGFVNTCLPGTVRWSTGGQWQTRNTPIPFFSPMFRRRRNPPWTLYICIPGWKIVLFFSFLFWDVLFCSANFKIRLIVVRMLSESQTVLTWMSRPVTRRLIQIQVVRIRYKSRKAGSWLKGRNTNGM